MLKRFNIPKYLSSLLSVAKITAHWIKDKIHTVVSTVTNVYTSYLYTPLTTLYKKIHTITSPTNKYLSALKNIILGCILLYYPNLGLARLFPTSILTVHHQKFVALASLLNIIFYVARAGRKVCRQHPSTTRGKSILSFVRYCCRLLLSSIISLINIVHFPLSRMAFLTMPHKYYSYSWEYAASVLLTAVVAINTGFKDLINHFLHSQYSLTSLVKGDKDGMLTYIKYLYSDSASIAQPACEYVRVYAPYIAGSGYLCSGLYKGLNEAKTDFDSAFSYDISF